MTLRGPLPRRRSLFSRPKLRTLPFLLCSVFDILFADEDSDRRLPMIGRKNRAIRDEIMGKFDVTTATKVSRTAHDPAFCAPLIGSFHKSSVSFQLGYYQAARRRSRQGLRDGGLRTAMISTQRRMPAAVTKIPPEKSSMRPAFLSGLREDFQSNGIGMLIRYMSVATFSTTVTKMSILEMAGWHASAIR